jgi:hypothetical protein
VRAIIVRTGSGGLAATSGHDMKIACAYCRKLFVPSLAQRAIMGGPGCYYCSHACVCAGKRAPMTESVLPKPQPVNWSYDLHIRAPDARAFRRLLRMLDDNLELVRVRRSEGPRRRWALQMVTQPTRPGSIVDLIRRAALERKPTVPAPATALGRPLRTWTH